MPGITLTVSFLFGFAAGIAFTAALLGVLFLLRRRSRLQILGFGNRTAWRKFNDDFPKFVEKHTSLQALRDKLFIRRVVPRHPVDYIVFGLGRVCIEDFEQALNLCGNGFGIGALQILRGMYERHVTAAYLAANPGDLEDFVNYHYVQQRKAIRHLEEAYRGDRDILNRLVTEADRRAVEENFKNLPDKFKSRCADCKRPLMTSWTTHSTAALAKLGGQGLDGLYYHQYFRPTLFTHSTFKSVEARVVDKPDGTFSFESEAQQKHIKEALISAHGLLLNVFDLQNKHFNLDLDEELNSCNRDYLECWAPDHLHNDDLVVPERAEGSNI